MKWLSCRSSSPLNVLTGEVLHDAGQNPIVASSIGKSQHTQISKVPWEREHIKRQAAMNFQRTKLSQSAHFLHAGLCRGFSADETAAVATVVFETGCICGHCSGQVLSSSASKEGYGYVWFSATYCTFFLWKSREFWICLSQVGKDKDAFFVCVRTRTATFPKWKRDEKTSKHTKPAVAG